MKSKLVPSYFITVVGILFFIWKVIDISTYPAKTSLSSIKGIVSSTNFESSEPEIILEGDRTVYYLVAGLKNDLIVLNEKSELNNKNSTILVEKGKPKFTNEDGVSYFLIYEMASGNEILRYEDIKDASLKISIRGLFLGVFLFISGLALRKYILVKSNNRIS